jgi:Putative zincin peptidase
MAYTKLQLIDRFHLRQRREEQLAIDAGRLHKLDELELLEPEALRPLARFGLLLLLGGGVFFIVLNLVVYYWQRHTLSLNLTFGGALLWLLINILGAIVILPLHELLHGLMFLLWGGRPFFGAKLPLALYCGARQQLFRRNQYIAVGLAPLVVITLAAFVLTLFSPVLASYTLFANLSNFSGAVGDLWSVLRMARLPANALIEDTDAGYRAWEITSD